ncbi:MAG: hypothetical protein EP343_15525 [Deltaproteobacteria bacterium]|nr:MAG: hypothetical protein EP343_15525 [Deltaproteobacteria bacterium]
MNTGRLIFLFVVGLMLPFGCSPSSDTNSDAGENTERGSTNVPETSSDTSSPGPSEGSLKIVTYNVHGLAGGITGDNTNERLKLIGPKLNVFVIAGLQEVFTEEGYTNLKAGVDHSVQHRFSKPLEGRAMGSGLMLLSRFKALEVKEEYFKDCNGTLDGASDCLASKGFQMIRYEIAPGVEIDVYNSHFEAGSGAKDNEARANHVKQVTTAMNAWSKGRAIVYLGDTNLKTTRESDQTALKAWMTAIGLLDSCEAVDCPKKGRIDRVLFRSGDSLSLGVKSWNIPDDFVYNGGETLSDHDPIVVELEWKRSSK